ncbi:reverse transcriptase domain-containing protein [Tanacetum coccineum]
MKLNLKKCTFGIEEGTFLGYKVNTEGIMVCPDKVGAVLNMPSPKCLKDVQKLNGKLASLNRLLSKSTEKSLTFFKTLKKCTKKSDFQWITKAEAAFKEMKKLIAELPTLTAPMEKEELIVYLAAAREVISAVLMTEREAKQMPVYFVSRALQGPEINYKSMEKLVLALVHASKRLKRYFQAHTIIIIIDQPIKQILPRLEVTGRLQKWSIELCEYDIQYRPRTSGKGKILVDFIVECPEDDLLDTPMEVEEELSDPWTLFTDGSSCVDGSGAGLILTNSEGAKFTYALRFRFDATINEAEYEALIAGLRNAKQMGVKNLQTNMDSRLVANQVNGSYIAKEPSMIQYLEKVKTLSSSFKKFSIKQVLVEELKEKYINEAKVLTVVEEEGDTWMTPIYNYLTEETLHAEKKKARVVRRKSGSMHVGTRSVVVKAIRTGYYWPTMHTDARKLIRVCQDCQVHRLVPRNPLDKLTPIMSPRPFYKWGIGIAGPFPEGPRKVKFLIVAMNYFTKWIEAKPVATITGNPFKDWCEKLCIRQCFSSVKHPQAHGLVERANRSLGEGIKARLDEISKDWTEELPHVLWAHHTMIKSSNEDTPFSLTYATEEVIPIEIGMPTMRTAEVDMVQNDEALEINLDLLEERREQAAIREAKSKAKMEKYYNSKIRNTSFKPGDLVYMSNEASHAKESGKLSPKWEGPCEVTKALGNGVYKLKDCNGKLLPRTWNVCNKKMLCA